MDKIENYFSAICKKLTNNKIEFENEVVVQGILVDFYISSSRTAIIVTEKEHDHGESYFAEMEEIKHLSSCGFTVIQLPLPNYPNPDAMCADLFRQMGL